MVRARRGVNLHTGNPTADARTPQWGASDVAGANASDPTFRRSTRRQHAPAKVCAWCGSTSNVGKREPLRCVRCLDFESVIANAHRYLAEHALRPLNASEESESDEELKVRRNALSAQRQTQCRQEVSGEKTGEAKHPTKSQETEEPEPQAECSATEVPAVI